MEQRDYLKRQIDQLAKILAKLAATLLGLPVGDISIRYKEVTTLVTLIAGLSKFRAGLRGSIPFRCRVAILL